jgi:hypothetical protein
MGFFKRRPSQRSADNQFTSVSEAIAQLASRDLAIGVLRIADGTGKSLASLRDTLRVILADDAPRVRIDACFARAIDLRAEIVQAFPVPGAIYRSLEAAVLGETDDFATCATELDLEPTVLRAKLLELHHLSAAERDAITTFTADKTAVVRGELRDELQTWVTEDPNLVPRYQDAPGAAVDVLALMLDALINQRVGGYARLGSSSQIGWAVLVDRLEGLRTLNATERKRLAPVCGYIRQESMFPTGIEKLLSTEP